MISNFYVLLDSIVVLSVGGVVRIRASGSGQLGADLLARRPRPSALPVSRSPLVTVDPGESGPSQVLRLLRPRQAQADLHGAASRAIRARCLARPREPHLVRTLIRVSTLSARVVAHVCANCARTYRLVIHKYLSYILSIILLLRY